MGLIKNVKFVRKAAPNRTLNIWIYVYVKLFFNLFLTTIPLITDMDLDNIPTNICC
jgi:hypothetical protein